MNTTSDPQPLSTSAAPQAIAPGIAAGASGSDPAAITPGPWTWEIHPARPGMMALTAGEKEVILATGDSECVWAEVSESDRRLIASAPDLLRAVEDLMEIVEGVRSRRWAVNGGRLKDTPEWCRLYVLRCAILRGDQNDKLRHGGENQ